MVRNVYEKEGGNLNDSLRYMFLGPTILKGKYIDKFFASCKLSCGVVVRQTYIPTAYIDSLLFKKQSTKLQ